MADGDLLLSALAAGLLKSQSTATQTQTGTPPPSGGGVSVAQFSPEQIAQLANAIRGEISQIQIPAPQVNVSGTLTATIPEEQLQRIVSAGGGKETPVNILNRTVQTDITGAGIHSLASPSSGSFPNLIRLASILFTQDVNLVGIVLSTSLLNTGTEVMGLFVARDTGAVINFSTPPDPANRANDIYLSILTHNNSTVGTNAPASRTSSIGFSPKSGGIQFKSASSISIYGCAQNLASALVTGVMSVYYTLQE